MTAAISVGLLLAMRVSLLTYEKLNQRLEDNRYTVGIQQTLERQISGVIPIVGDCGAVHVPVFSGGPQSLRLLSNYSLAEGSRGYPRIIEYQVAPDPRGGVRLMMNERLYGGVATVAPLCSGNALLPVQLDGQSIEAVGRLAFCSLEYHEYIPEAPLQGNWVPAWNRPALPGAVRIQMAALPEGPARLPVLTLEVPLRISRDLGAAYVDQ